MQKVKFTPHLAKVQEAGCISLIGMAAAGKTTIGKELAQIIDWPSFDSDHLIESIYGVPLQAITDQMTKEEFLDLESVALCGAMVRRFIISTGGSVVYRKKTMDFLHSLGPVVYIDVPLPIILERIARKPERGLAIEPGQTIEDLYYERAKLYEKYSSWALKGGNEPASVYATQIAQWLAQP